MSELLNIYKTLKSKKWVNLSHKIDENSPKFPALPALEKENVFTLKDGFYVQKFSVVGQYGTHIDAPIHFVEGGRWLDEIELKDLFGKPKNFCKSELKRRIKEALIQDERILDVNAFSFEDKKRRELAVTFTANTIYGDVNITKGVQI